MKLVIQRARQARVLVGNETVGAISHGAVVLVGIACGDSEADVRHLARKTSLLRIYSDEQGRLNAPIQQSAGAFLVVSQFTLYGDCRKGNRPSYIESAPPEEAKPLFALYVESLRELGHDVRTGVFREHMLVELQNDGPVTVILESRGRQE